METPVLTPRSCFHSARLSFQTERARQFVDITDEVVNIVAAVGVQAGMLVITSQHTTASIVVNEHEPLLLQDLDQLLQRIAPEGNHYQHNGVPCGKGEQPNGHAHCQALLLSTSASIPIAGGQPVLGRYQRIFLVELDCPRPRDIMVVILGTA